MTLIWATRGREWGFRFLHDGGFADPLPAYDAVISRLGHEPDAWCRVGRRVGLRLQDPLGRKDFAGRAIPHEFVVPESEADEINSVEDGLSRIWPRVADEYARIWDQPAPPTPN